ncbi:MAG: rhodanese-like domain-containing protein [Myxococcales bacterium]|jgi:rhodanese-related sulfurtransferase|nr:rhodanese-like domain-containing protein [Myxococcales bacterium]
MTVKRITPQEAYDLMEDEGYVYVDVRSVPEFEGGHPEGAYNVPLLHRGPRGLEPNPDFMKVMEACFDKDQKIIVGCQVGGRSLKACEQLLAAGFTGVVDQLAGFGGAKDAFGGTAEPGWQAAGLPVSIHAEAGRDYESLRKKVSS